MHHKGIRLALILIEAFIGLGAIGGGIAILTGAFAHWLPVAWLAGTPFSNYTIPGLLLLIVIGGGMLLAAATVFMQRAWAMLLQASMGLVMIAFEGFEVAIIDRYAQAVIASTVVQQVLMSSLGLLIFGLACFLWMSEYRAHHFPTRPVRHA
jgi:hypothetical protein